MIVAVRIKPYLLGIPMRFVRIIDTPPGEAPEEIRRSWVGLVLPMHKRQKADPITTRGAGVLTGPRSLGALLWALVSGRTEKMRGYLVPSRESIELLDGHAPDAAAWWREHARHLLEPEKALLFTTECCEVVDRGADA